MHESVDPLKNKYIKLSVIFCFILCKYLLIIMAINMGYPLGFQGL